MTGATAQTVSARTMLQNGHFRYWLQGPIVTAVIIEDRTLARTYDKDFGDGSKALHPIYEAWFYPQNKKVELGYTVENTWASNTVSKSMRDQTYSLTLQSGNTNPTTEFTQPSFTHIGKSRWHKTFWVGALDPAKIRIDHNLKYLVTTNAIPNYDTNLQIAPALVDSYYSAWQNADKTLDGNAAGIGNYRKALASAGGHDWIGLMNRWDELYLFTMDDRMREAVLGNADLSGRIPFRFREADTLIGMGRYYDKPITGSVDTFGRPVSINARMRVTLEGLTPNYYATIAVCNEPLGTDVINIGPTTDDGWGGYNMGLAHFPDFSYIPYLLTGNYYYLEDLQYEGAYIVGSKLGCSSLPSNRQADAGYLHNEIRGDAWGMRTLAYASFLSPDGTPEKAYFEDKLGNNIAEWEGEHNLPISNLSKQVHWDFGNTQRRDPKGPSPLGVWQDRGPIFVQSPLRQDGYLASGASPWEENFLIAALGMAKQFGYGTDKLLQFMAKTRIHNLLDLASLKYLVEQYRIPAKLSGTNDWIKTWQEFTNSYSTIPTAWNTVTGADAYSFIALGAMSFLAPYTVDGYSGLQAWNLFKAEMPRQNLFATEDPEWAILPRVTGTPPPTPLTGDLNNDRTVNSLDWTIMEGVWFTADATADLNSDGIVNSIDFSLMNANWGKSQ